MDEEKRKRYEELKEKNKYKHKNLRYQTNPRFMDCIETLGEVRIYSYEFTEKIMHVVSDRFPLSYSNSILDKMSNTQSLCDIEVMREILDREFPETAVYIFFTDYDIPLVSCRKEKVIRYYDEIMEVSLDNIYIISFDLCHIIESRLPDIRTYGKSTEKEIFLKD